jgi:hypothetical protein
VKTYIEQQADILRDVIVAHYIAKFASIDAMLADLSTDERSGFYVDVMKAKCADERFGIFAELRR